MELRYTADVYYRLSREDLNRGDESCSISNQRMIVERYCRENDIVIVKEFVDDGYSGGNFDRPGFKAMLEHIEKEKIGMVITKDLSRLGRDMTESSRFAEEYFPEHNVLYIAVADNFSSEETNTFSPFLFAFNDFYLRDTSQKIRNVLSVKRERGEYCCCAPFGYMKDPNDKTKLIPNPETAGIIQRIFQLATEGNGSHRIADILTEDHVVTPSVYKLNGNYHCKAAEKANDKWTHTTVKRILQNRVYLGHTVLGKSKKISYKSKRKKPIPQEEWTVHENTHQALVSVDAFDKANAFLGMHKKSWRDAEDIRKSIFSGIVFCKNCGASLCSGGTVYKGERDKYWYLYCNNITNKKHPCMCGARIKYANLVDIISKELNSMIALNESEIEEIIDEIMKAKTGDSIYDSEEQQLKNSQKKAENLLRAIQKVYSDFAAGTIDEDIHRSMLEELQQQYRSERERIEQLENNRSYSDDLKAAYESFYALIKGYSNFEVLTPEIVRTFIDRIEIGEQQLPPGYQIASHDSIPVIQDIIIYYRFIGAPDSLQFNVNSKE